MTTLRFGIPLLIASAAAASCGGGDSGLVCKSGDFYLDGQKFTSCDQCGSADCAFEGNASETCTYPNGVQHCTVSSGTVTAHCGAQRASVTISNGVYTCGSTASGGAAGASGGSGAGTDGAGGAGGAMDPFADCTFPTVTAAETAATSPTRDNSTDLSGATLGDVAFDPSTMRRTVPVTVQSTPAGLQAGLAYLTRPDSSETAYLTIPVMNSGTSYLCFVKADPLQYLSSGGTVLSGPTNFDYLSGSVGDVGSGLYTDTCLAPGETGYLVDIQSSSGVAFFSGTASIQLTLSSSSTGSAPGGHLVPQRYDIGTCSGTRSIRVTSRDDATLPVAVGDGGLTLSPVIYLDGTARPAGWSFLENRLAETVQPGASTNSFANIPFDPAVTRAQFFIDFDAPTAALQLEAATNDDGPLRELQRIRSRRLDLIGHWRAAHASGASHPAIITRARDLPALGLDRFGDRAR